MSKPPLHEIRYGLIKASIWENATQHGTTYSVSVTRLFKNSDQWKESSRFGRDDLLLLGKVANEAHTWISRKGQKQGTNEDDA